MGMMELVSLYDASHSSHPALGSYSGGEYSLCHYVMQVIQSGKACCVDVCSLYHCIMQVVEPSEVYFGVNVACIPVKPKPCMLGESIQEGTVACVTV